MHQHRVLIFEIRYSVVTHCQIVFFNSIHKINAFPPFLQKFPHQFHFSAHFESLLNRFDATCFADMEGPTAGICVYDDSILEEIQGWVWRVSYAHEFRRLIINNLNK